MAKDSYYFSHDYNARNDEKILELRAEFGAEGYGVFWMIVETMAENENGGVKASLIGGLSLGYGVAKDRLSLIIDRCLSLSLFYEEDGYYFSNRLLEHKKYRKELSEYGSKGANSRWGGHREAIAPLMQRKGKERKGNKGVAFGENNETVVFSDGSQQKLGLSQKSLVDIGELKPEDVIKGLIN
jgi:hypothetical protein